MAIIKKQEEAPPEKLTEALAANVLASQFDWFRNCVLPNVHLCGGEMDVAVITPAGYLWEVEIKLTLSDWKADAKKMKWTHRDRRFVSRFYYAVPEDLIEKVPDFVPESAGLIKFYHHKYMGQWFATVVRTPTGSRGEKVPDSTLKKLREKAYFRYWRLRYRMEESNKQEYDGSLEDL